MDQNNCVDERWLVSSSTEFKEEEEEGDDDEALSLSDLPLIHQWRKEKGDDDDDNKNNSPSAREGVHVQEEFDFCSVSKESEMCAADEVFFQGQILPLRHSVSSEKGLVQHYDGRRYRSHSISRSDSMDHYYSSRSSSISSGSGSSSSAATVATKYKPKLPPRNQFHSHPSPSPRLHFPSSRHGGATSTNHRNSIKKSSVWNVLRLGLVSTPPEIAFHDLKARSTNSSTNCKSFGSRNSTSSNSSSITSSGGGGASKIKKMRPRLLGGCKCAADAVDTVAPRVVIIKRSASESDVVALNDEIRGENGGESKPQSQKLTKKHLSHHRTFEWLKQLSVEGAAADEA